MNALFRLLRGFTFAPARKKPATRRPRPRRVAHPRERRRVRDAETRCAKYNFEEYTKHPKKLAYEKIEFDSLSEEFAFTLDNRLDIQCETCDRFLSRRGKGRPVVLLPCAHFICMDCYDDLCDCDNPYTCPICDEPIIRRYAPMHIRGTLKGSESGFLD